MAATEVVPNQAKTEAITAHVLWITTGLSCEGDSVAMTSATNPSLEDIITGAIPGMPRVVIHNQVIAYEVGQEYIQAWFDAEQGKLDPFVLVIEGSLGNEQINGEGHWTGFGVNPANGQPITVNEWVDRLAPKAAAVVAVGTCATYGGIPAMKNNPTGAMGVPDYLGWKWKSKAGHPDREHPRLPGAARQHDRDAGAPRVRPGGHGAGARARRGRPAGVAVRPHRPRELQPRRLLPSRATSPPSTAPTTAAWSSSAARARWSSATCPLRGWQNHMGGCPNVGGICMACTMPGFPDKYMPFMDEDPNARLSSNLARFTYGPILRWGRKQSVKRKFDNEPEWRHNRAELTTGYAKRW